MSHRKERPALNAPVTAGMSLRDMAAALGTSKSEVQRWYKLAELPEELFEQRLKEYRAGMRKGTSTGILAERVPARGRVQRALGIVANMTATERADFFTLLDYTP